MAKKKEDKPAKTDERSVLLPVLTILLVVVGIAEAALLSFIGVRAVPYMMNRLTASETEQQPASTPVRDASTPIPTAVWPDPSKRDEPADEPDSTTEPTMPEGEPSEDAASGPEPIQISQPVPDGNTDTAGQPTSSTPPPEEEGTIYITRTGERYHYDSTCNGATYFPSTLSEAQNLGLTPCEKCVLN